MQFADLDACDPADPAVGHPLDLAIEPHHQSDGDVVDMRHRDDADPPHFDAPGDLGGSAGDQDLAGSHHQSLVVADQRRAAINQPQREVGLAGARRAFDQDGATADGDCGGMQPVRGQDGQNELLQRGSASGRRTTKRAPPSRSSRDSTMIVP